MSAKAKAALISEIKRHLACLPDKNLEDTHIMVKLIADGNTMMKAAISSLGTILKERDKLAAEVAELRKIEAVLDRKITDKKDELIPAAEDIDRSGHTSSWSAEADHPRLC